MSRKTTAAHVLTLNNGAMHLIPQVATENGLSNPMHIVALGRLLEDHFLDLPKPPPLAPGTDRLTAVRQTSEWARKGAHSVPCSEAQREAIKAVFRKAVENNSIPAGPASLCVLEQVGLADGT